MGAFQRATAWIDLGAIERNAARLGVELSDGCELCAVVKANGYGHGMIEAARAALVGGASRLAVVAASEAFELRESFAEVPVLLMGPLTDAELDVALGGDAELAVWDPDFLELVAGRAARLGRLPRVHIKHDTGMGRLGEKDPDRVRALLEAADRDQRIELAGLWTHFATADDRDSDFFATQLDRFRELALLARERHGVMLHAANSAATLRDPDSHLDFVRCGIAIYGLDPFGADPGTAGLEPALGLSSYLAEIKRFSPGESAGYGRTWTAERQTSVGLVPIGYGDGVRRALGNRSEVLIAGRRYPIVGTISMDSITVDLGPDPEPQRGEEVVLVGASGQERITAEEMAARLGTINYEITCGIGARVPRVRR